MRPVRQALLALMQEHRPNQAAEISVMIAEDAEIQRLNREFRKVDSTTDVLSFPAAPNPLGHLGDIAISTTFAERQAKLRRVSWGEEAAMLAVHGGLHLLGMDDSTDEERDEMVREMNRIMAIAGLPVDSEWFSLPHGEGDGEG